jgi:hypothetical protein
MCGRVDASLAIILSACLALAAWVPGEARGAADETRYELIADGTIFGNDLIRTGLAESVFHQQKLAAADDESLNISFTRALPFSPSQSVYLALPSIHEAAGESVDVSSTGFFTADLPFYPCCNFGAAPVGVGQFGKLSPVTPARLRGSALMYPEMINKGILNPNLTYENKNINNTMVTLPPGLAASPYGEVAAIANATIGETAVNGSAPGNITPPLLLSTHRFNFDSNASRISNFSVVERMWRNSHLAHLMDIAYEGESSRPVWMAPLKPAETLQLTNHFKVLSYALNMTRPGEYLTKTFWDLEPVTPGKL